MMRDHPDSWQEHLVSPDEALERIEPGMNIFLGTGAAEPRTLVKRLMTSEAGNLQDLTLIQLISLADAISIKDLRSQKYRLKTFFSGWVAGEAIAEGHVDLIPSRFSGIPNLILRERIPIDVAFIQVTEPNEAAYCSLGIAVDVARQVMQKASLVVGEINNRIPRTYGDTFVPVGDFDLLVKSEDPPLFFPRPGVDPVLEKVAVNVASIIEDGSCIGFNIGPLFEALAEQLKRKRDLGIHSPFFTDAVMELVKSGAVSNRRKGSFRGKSLTSYAIGSEALLRWLDRNPLVEFQGVDKVFSPMEIGRNPNFVAVFSARRVDLSGRVALPLGAGHVPSGPGQSMDFFNGAEISRDGYTIFALPSRNRKGQAGICLTVEGYPNILDMPESVDVVITEHGVAPLTGRTLRERAQALIEVAHPDDRRILVEQAKANHILYPDQIFIPDSAHLYPSEIVAEQPFKNGITVRFRAIKPSDEEEMRRLFYRFSDEAVYYRYFTPVKTMPHARMQEYVNVDYRRAMSIVGLVGPPGHGHIIAEGRFVQIGQTPYVETAFVVDEQYQGLGIGAYLYRMLARIAIDRGYRGLTAEVLASNKAMLKVFENGGYPVDSHLDGGIYELKIRLGPSRPR